MLNRRLICTNAIVGLNLDFDLGICPIKVTVVNEVFPKLSDFANGLILNPYRYRFQRLEDFDYRLLSDNYLCQGILSWPNIPCRGDNKWHYLGKLDLPIPIEVEDFKAIAPGHSIEGQLRRELPVSVTRSVIKNILTSPIGSIHLGLNCYHGFGVIKKYVTMEFIRQELNCNISDYYNCSQLPKDTYEDVECNLAYGTIISTQPLSEVPHSIRGKAQGEIKQIPNVLDHLVDT